MEEFLAGWLARVATADLGFMGNRVARELHDSASAQGSADFILTGNLADKLARRQSDIDAALAALESAELIELIDARPAGCRLL